jgi:acyl carrier protein
MTRGEIFEVIKANIGRIVEGAAGKTVTEDMSMKDFGADSLEIVEVVSRSMKELRLRVPRTELSSAKDLKDLLDLFEKAAAQVKPQS